MMFRWPLSVAVLAIALSACGGEDTASTNAASSSSPTKASEPPSLEARGRKAFRECATCHTVTPDGRHMVGPNLYGVVGREAAQQPGFNYSKALKESGIVWTAEELDRYIADPLRAVPGNRMAYRGMTNPQQREAVIAWLKTLSDEAPASQDE